MINISSGSQRLSNQVVGPQKKWFGQFHVDVSSSGCTSSCHPGSIESTSTVFDQCQPFRVIHCPSCDCQPMDESDLRSAERNTCSAASYCQPQKPFDEDSYLKRRLTCIVTTAICKCRSAVAQAQYTIFIFCRADPS